VRLVAPWVRLDAHARARVDRIGRSGLVRVGFVWMLERAFAWLVGLAKRARPRPAIAGHLTIHPGAEKEPAECGPRGEFLPEDEEFVQKGGTVMGRQRNVNPLPVNLMFGGSMRPWESVSATGGGGSG
jgi:hypothetical protein